MNRILKLILDDYCNQKPSAEYRLMQQEVCEAQSRFMAGLSKKQKKEFLELDSLSGQLITVAQDDLSVLLFETLKLYFR